MRRAIWAVMAAVIPGTGCGVWQGSPVPPALRILFVRAEGQWISGRLGGYQDLRTGERLLTTFEGRLYRNEFKDLHGAHRGHRASHQWRMVGEAGAEFPYMRILLI